eukprot:Skav221070  [mRNA]  locus=scaffold3118:272977:273507:- [translate_table: standard]
MDGYEYLCLSELQRSAGDRLRVVCISDTHNHHRKLQLPPGDILIHAGDFTDFGKEENARDFNDWLGDPRSFQSFSCSSGTPQVGQKFHGCPDAGRDLSHVTLYTCGSEVHLPQLPKEQTHKTKLVVLGNHENNSPWNTRAADILSNAVLLRPLAIEIAMKRAVQQFNFVWLSELAL